MAQECPLTPTLSPNGARAIGVSYRHAVNAGAVCFTSPQRGEVGRRPGEGLMPGNPGTPPLPIGARCRLHCTALHCTQLPVSVPPDDSHNRNPQYLEKPKDHALRIMQHVIIRDSEYPKSRHRFQIALAPPGPGFRDRRDFGRRAPQ